MARILIGNIKGPRGEQGVQGERGIQGPPGPQGPLPPLINNALATQAGVAALDAAMGKTFQDEIDSTNRNFLSSIRFLTAEETTTASLTWKHYRPRVMCTSSWDGLNSGNCPAENNLWIIVHLPWTQYKSTEDNAITKGYQLWFGIDSKTIYERWLIDENWSEFIQKTF